MICTMHKTFFHELPLKKYVMYWFICVSSLTSNSFTAHLLFDTHRGIMDNNNLRIGMS